MQDMQCMLHQESTYVLLAGHQEHFYELDMTSGEVYPREVCCYNLLLVIIRIKYIFNIEYVILVTTHKILIFDSLIEDQVLLCKYSFFPSLVYVAWR